MAKTPSAKLGLKHHIGYGAGDAGGVLMLITISYLERFSRNVLGVDPLIYAGILLVWNIWDAINDPLVGTFMDVMFSKAKNKTDKFRPWILRSIPILAVGQISLFIMPTLFDGLLCIITLFVSKIVFELGYTVMNIGMGSLLGVMATNDEERASLSSARGFGSTVGGMVGMMSLPQILSALGENTFGYAVTGIAAAVLGGILVFIHFAWTEERNAAAQVAGQGQLVLIAKYEARLFHAVFSQGSGYGKTFNYPVQPHRGVDVRRQMSIAYECLVLARHLPTRFSCFL